MYNFCVTQPLTMHFVKQFNNWLLNC